MIFDKKYLIEKLEYMKAEFENKKAKLMKNLEDNAQLERDMTYTLGKIDLLTGLLNSNLDGEKIEQVRGE